MGSKISQQHPVPPNNGAHARPCTESLYSFFSGCKGKKVEKHVGLWVKIVTSMKKKIFLVTYDMVFFSKLQNLSFPSSTPQIFKSFLSNVKFLFFVVIIYPLFAKRKQGKTRWHFLPLNMCLGKIAFRAFFQSIFFFDILRQRHPRE